MDFKNFTEKFRPQVMAVIAGIVLMAMAAMRWDGLEELKTAALVLGPIAMAIINKQKSEDQLAGGIITQVDTLPDD